MPRTSKAVQEINGILQPDDLAGFISDKYVTWRNASQPWRELSKELRNYIFQTDTTQTTNAKLPWKNKTSVPKLCQLRDNLHANYFAALFPNDNFFRWKGSRYDENARETARKIEAYMRQKIRESNFAEVVSDALYDYIDYGNAFGEVTFVVDQHENEDGTTVTKYAGPKAHRISPYDIFFDITASSFKDSGKITRRIVSMGSLKRAERENPEAFGWVSDALEDTIEVRAGLNNYGDSDIDKSEGMQIDGFGTLKDYYSSDMIELLEWEGDLFDANTGEFYEGHRIIVMDRRKVVYKAPFKSWLGRSNKEHVSWRPRPDNLMGMGPLDNLVGMQYRLDHLENLKADVFDQIAHPVVYERGHVEDWQWGPGEKIFGSEESEVRVLAPDTTALNADFQMQQLMQNMEELAGAPRQAMGIRTPGEKTAFEVQALENAAGRIFQQKIRRFEKQFLEPLLNQMLAAARENITASEKVQVLNEDLVVEEFLTVTKEDLNKQGKLYPIGARHYAQQAQVVQNLSGMLATGVLQDPAVAAHVSGLRIARLLEESLGLEEYELVEPNVRIIEQMQTQEAAAAAQEEVAESIQNRQVADDTFAEGTPSE